MVSSLQMSAALCSHQPDADAPTNKLSLPVSPSARHLHTIHSQTCCTFAVECTAAGVPQRTDACVQEAQRIGTVSVPFPVQAYDHSKCGVEYSTADQVPFCAVDSPPVWPALMQAPAIGLRGPASPTVVPSGLLDPGLPSTDSPLLFTGTLRKATADVVEEPFWLSGLPLVWLPLHDPCRIRSDCLRLCREWSPLALSHLCLDVLYVIGWTAMLRSIAGNPHH